MIPKNQNNAVVNFYDTHPINEWEIIQKLRQDGVDLARVTEDDLQRYDQDHYGGLAANDALADAAGIDADCHVLDVCCGMGGPARYFAHRLGCRVSGIDLTESRVDGAQYLTEIVGLDHLVDLQLGNALDLPFADETFDVVVSQEAFCHVPHKDRLVAECVRVLKPGGRFAFTDIFTTAKTDGPTRERLADGMTFQELATADDYRAYLEAEGCSVSITDLSAAWRDILARRLEMYRGLKDETVARYGAAHFDRWDDNYSFFVGLYRTGALGGGRVVATRASR